MTLYKKGDRVRITDPESVKYNMTGTVTNVFCNCVMLELSSGRFTPVKFSHLEKLQKDKEDG